VNLKALRRRCQERLLEIDLPVPFDASSFCDALAARRGRPILLLPVPAKEGPFGLWIATAEADYIFFERDTSRWHQEHIILHEVCHLLWDHDRSHVSDDEVIQMLLPSLAPQMVQRVLQRSAYSREDEREAELLATLILERVGGTGGSGVQRRRAEPNDPVARLEAILDGGSERGRDE
jgi:hypothetical protein